MRPALAVALVVLLAPAVGGGAAVAPSSLAQALSPKSAAPTTADANGAATPAAGLDGYIAAAPKRPTAAPADVQESAPPGAEPVTTIVDDPRCGPGFTSSALTGSSKFACYHSAFDPLPEIAGPVAQAKTAAPACMGNGVNGPRLQLIYMYVEGQPDRTSVMVPRIVNEFVPRMEAVFRETSKLQGREIGMRLHMPDCQLTVDTVMIDAASGAPDHPFRMAPRINRALSRAGFGSSDRKFLLWFDGGNGDETAAACGMAPAYAPVLERGYNPTPANTSNIGWHDVMIEGEVAVTFRYGQPILGDAPPPRYGQPPVPECWGRGATGARTELHELLHLIGAVNWSAPNWNGADSHCLDDHDIMCQVGGNGTQKFLRCNTPIEQLDCGSDDYFNARPAAGSYLSTHWNTANSRFLGDAIVHDNVPIEIPRP